MRPNQFPLQWVSGDLSREVNLPGRESGRSLPSGAKVRSYLSYRSTPLCCFNGVNRNSITFTLHVACNLKVYDLAGNAERRDNSDCEVSCDVKKKQ